VKDFLAAHAAGAPVALPTSGTSGAPRWIVRTTESWTSSFAAVSELVGLTASSRVWVPGPLSATMNLFAAVHATVLSARLVDGPATATHAHLTPTALTRLLDDRTPLAGLTLVVAGDRLPRVLRDRAVDAGAVVHHYYGAAELSFVAWGSHTDDLVAFPGVDVAVRDGDIWVRTPYLCSGYAGPPGPLRVGSDGFATVGDRGRLTDGRIVVTGRPDAVVVAGTVVEATDVEAALRGHAVGELAVVGVPHRTLGRVLAVVLTEPRDLDGVRRLARAHLDGARRPRLWFEVPALPSTPAGKLDRQALVSLVSGADEGVRRLV
jgi:long-chain acyl-CoA synthetase